MCASLIPVVPKSLLRRPLTTSGFAQLVSHVGLVQELLSTLQRRVHPALQVRKHVQSCLLHAGWLSGRKGFLCVDSWGREFQCNIHNMGWAILVHLVVTCLHLKVRTFKIFGNSQQRSALVFFPIMVEHPQLRVTINDWTIHWSFCTIYARTMQQL